MKRITCREIGEKLGVCHSTVSLALRNHPSLPPETRKRIQDFASQLGYRPDPALAALNAYRQAKRGIGFKATLGWIDNFPERADIRSSETFFHKFFQGASQRAAELGYKVEEFWAPTPDHWSRLPRLLKSRGIEGLLVPPPPSVIDLSGQNAFPWHDFFAVALGQTAGPTLHLVINNQFQGAALAVEKLHGLGHRKIALASPTSFAKHTNFNFVGGYHSECARSKIRPLIHLEDSPSRARYIKRTAQWLREHRPDALIASGPDDSFPALDEAGLKVPDDIALAFLARFSDHPEIAAIDQNDWQIGVESANQLTDLIKRNERGVPEFPIGHLIRGTWVDGASASPSPSLAKAAGEISR